MRTIPAETGHRTPEMYVKRKIKGGNHNSTVLN